MRVLVCGGRDFGTDGPKGPQYKFIIKTLEEYVSKWCLGYPSVEKQLPEGIFVIAGKAKGVDTVAIDWAVVNWLGFQEYPAQWDKYGRSAGPIRNQQMLDEGKPDLVLAFPGGRGTADMVKRAKQAGVEVIEVPYT